MRRILDYFNPNKIPAYLQQSDLLSIWQERVLHYILMLITAFGWIGMTILNVSGITASAPHLNTRLLPFFVVTTLLFVLRSWNYKRRVHIISGIFTIGAIVFLHAFGINGTSVILLLLPSVFSAVMVNTRSAVINAIFSTLVIVVSGFGFYNGFFPIPEPNTYLSDPFSPINTINWSVFTFTTLLIIGLSISQFTSNFRKAIKQQEHLSKTLESERSKLALEVDSQTKSLQERLNQLQTVAYISSEINKSIDIGNLLDVVVNMVKSSFDLYYVGVFLIDDLGEYAVLRSGSGEEGQQMLNAGHRLAVNGPSMIGWATGKKEPRIALDVGEEPVHFNNPYLPYTHSEMALPMIGKNERVVGAMTIQSHRQNDFDEDDILVLQNIANSLAIALENAELLQESQEALNEIESLNRLYVQRSWRDFLVQNQNLEAEYSAGDDNVQTFSSVDMQTLSIPINLRNQKIGEIELDIPSTKLASIDQSLIEALSDQIAYALENTRLMEQSIRQASQEQRINELSTEFFKATRIEDVVRTALEEIGTIPYVSEVNIQLQPRSENKPGLIEERN